MGEGERELNKRVRGRANLSELHDKVEQVGGGVLGGVGGEGGVGVGRLEEVLDGDPLAQSMIEPLLSHGQLTTEVHLDLGREKSITFLSSLLSLPSLSPPPSLSPLPPSLPPSPFPPPCLPSRVPRLS